jgi:hypothetical protein
MHGIGRIDWDDMFLRMVLVHMVEMAILEIIDVAVMENRGMSTVGTVLVSTVAVMFLGVGGHSFLPSWISAYVAPLSPNIASTPSLIQ